MLRIKPLSKINKELLTIFILIVIIGIIYFFASNQRAFLNFFYLPVLLGAFLFGKKFGTYSAILSVLLVCNMAYFIPNTFSDDKTINNNIYRWLDIVTWGGFLILSGYLIGYLYEKKEAFNRELKKTYFGIITMLSIVIDSVDKHTHNHSVRVSRYAEKIAKAAGLPESEVEDIRIAALLHDIGKIGVSAEVLSKIGSLTEIERKEIVGHTSNASALLEPLGGKVLKILPLILNHHERYDGKGYYGLIGDSIPIGARIIAVADVYDALVSERPYKKAMSPAEVRNEITKGTVNHFDPEVVKYFQEVFLDISSDQYEDFQKLLQAS